MSDQIRKAVGEVDGWVVTREQLWLRGLGSKQPDPATGTQSCHLSKAVSETPTVEN